MIIVFDGPEKAGKTTLINAFGAQLVNAGFSVRIRHWGPVDPDDRVYTPALREDAANDDLITIWDRSWAAEYVYATLLNRDRRLNGNAFLGEWLHSRTVQTVGFRVMVLASAHEMSKLRDDTDLDVDPYEELSKYVNYSAAYGWRQVFNGYTGFSLRTNIAALMRWTESKMNRLKLYPWRPPEFAGPFNAPVLFVGRARNAEHRTMSGGWLPFTSYIKTRLGRELGPLAMKCAWTNLEDLTEDMMADRQMIVFCGSDVEWPAVNNPNTFTLNIPYPSTYRFDVDPYVRVNGHGSRLPIREWVSSAVYGYDELKGVTI